jgi:hypothetical protein
VIETYNKLIVLFGPCVFLEGKQNNSNFVNSCTNNRCEKSTIGGIKCSVN